MTAYALVDCDAFFCNCERLFREDLRHVPVIVLSNNDGCAVARTKEAKELGIDMGAPYHQIRELCDKHGVAVFSSNFSLYTDISSRIMRTLKRFAPQVEVYSVDEAFLDLTGVPDPEAYCRKIRHTIQKNIGMPISIGLAPTKGLCKAACFWAKKDPNQKGVVSLLHRSMQDYVLEQMPVEKIWGIGRKRGESLRMAKITTAQEFRDFTNDRLIQKILTKVGRMIQEEMRGTVCYPITLEGEKKKQIMSSRTFGSPVYLKRVLAESVATHATEVAEELRHQRSVCAQVGIFIRSNPFKEGIPQYARSNWLRLDSPTACTFKLIEASLDCLDGIFRAGIEYRKAGVMVQAIQDDDEHDLSLFVAPDSDKEKKIMEVVDRINAREGGRLIQSMSCGVDNREWKMNRNYKSPRFTTAWDELPEFT